MNAAVETINTAGRAFISFALPMLIQSSLLILILLAVDAVLRKRVRAVFRYWIWMLVLVKLMLPPSLWSPVSLGTWFGATLEAPTVTLLEAEEPPSAQAPALELVSPAVSILSQPRFVRPEPPVSAAMETMPQTPVYVERQRDIQEQAGLVPAETSEATAAVPSPSATLNWQGLTLVIWAAVVGALLLLLVQRAFFVRGLVAQADGAGQALLDVLQECRGRAGVRGQVSLRFSPNAMSPAVCGLIRPVILVPQNLAPRLHARDLRAVLLHELAHVKRGDLWVNLVQTLLQIVYFYHPLLWLANAAMRRAREQAVDEAVLVALGETAAQYPETLVNVAKLAFKRRPALSLRLIGVVESKSALTARIRHILTRPLPRTAKLGALSLVVIAVTALVLLPMAGVAEQHASTVSAGPLDIRLIGVSPDGSDELYGADGKKLDTTPAPLGLSDGPWEADQQRRDFVFEVPRFDGQLLFLPFPPLCPAGTNYRLGGFVNVLGPDDSPSTVVVSGTFARTYRRSWARIFTHEVPVRKVDLTLQYFHGPRREALCTFTGPFRMGQVVQADEGRPCQLTPQPFDTGRESWIKFHFTTNESFEHNMPVLLYDKQGRRHLLRGSGGGSISPRGADLTYEDDSILWDQIAAITIGEKPHEIAFRNIKVHYPGRPQRTYPDSLDAMAQRLNLTGLEPEKLGGYRFRNLDEAFAVLDIARGRSQIGKIVKTCKQSRPPVDFTALRPDVRNTIHRTATSWAQSPSVWVRARGVELGLMAGFGEFIDPAFALLDYRHPEDLRATHDVQYQVLSGLGRYPNGLPAAEMDRLIQFALRCTDGYTWGCLFRECLRNPRHAGLTNVLWGLARDDRPWVWWPAVAQLLLRNDKRLKAYADLPERMKLRLILVDFRQLPGEESLRPKARAMLPGLLTAETVRMCPEIASDLRRAITADLDHKEATAVYMSLLREVSRPGTVWRFREDHGEQHLLYSFVPALVRDVNLWYGVNIGQLGLFEPGKVNERLPDPDTLVRVAAEAVDWYQTHAEQPPRELPFEGRVVDSGGKPIAGATVTLHQEIIVATGLGEGTVHEGGVTTTQTDSEGHFVFQNPPPAKSDRLRLAVAAAGFADHVNIQVDQLQDGRFYFGADPANNVIVLEKPAVLRGRAIGRDGKPLALTELTLYLYPTHGVPNAHLMRTDAQGHFVYGSIMSGIHLLRYGESIRHGAQDNYPGLTAAKLIRIEEGQIVDDVVLDLRESTACLDIEIVNSAGQPIGADRVSLEILATSRKPPHPWVLSLDDVKPQGVHRVPNLPPLEGYLSVLAAGQPFKAVPVKLVANETTHYKVVFAEDASRHWNLATDMTGAPVDGAAPDRPAPLGASQGLASVDTDGDGLSDFQEVHKYLTDPAKTDSDGDGTPDGDWDERREYTYSVRTVLRYLPPFDEDGLNDDFQDARVLNRTGEYIEVEVIHYPLATSHESIVENRNWKQDYAHMTEYLAPGVTTNWDEQMRRDLLAALKADGIDVESLTDKQVVEQVSRWLLRRSRSLDKVFTTYYVDYQDGRPRVYPGLEDAFRHEFERDSGNYDWTIEQHFDHELLGKGMFYNKTHGSCTSTAVYLTTVLRALGIPTRIILASPAVDASDRAQILMVKNAITHHRVRLTMLAGLGRSSHGWTNHTFNEVYVGNRWYRLDGSQLGCPAFGLHRFGLQTHLYTLNDLSDVNFAPTWGRRYAKGERNGVFQHDNPYSAVEVSELFGPHGDIPNPPFTARDLASHPQPDIFLFYPARVNVWQEFVGLVEGGTFNKTSRPHQKESYENLFDGIWLTRPQDILVLLFSLDTSERVPEGYEDLLPKPWPEIESALQRGETVELSGQARAMNVILLAAPTSDALKPLVSNSQLLRAISGAGPVPSAASTPPAALAPPATKPAKLPNGVTIGLLGISEYPSEGKPWWRPDGSTLDAAPYKTTNNKRELKEGFRDYELVVRYGGAPDMDIEWDVPGSASTGSPYDADGEPIRDLTVCTVRFPEDRTTTKVRVAAAAGAWETRATHRSVNREGTYSLGSGRSVAFGIAHFQDGRTLVPVTTNFFPRDINFRVVAVRAQNEAYTGGLSGSGGNNLNSLTYIFNCPLSDIQALRFQTRPWTWVEFRNVALRPGLRPEAQAEVLSSEKANRAPRRAPGEEKVLGIGPAWKALRDAVGGRYRGTIAGFSTDESTCAEYFEKVLSWAGPGDTFVLMFAFDRAAAVPAQYQDLLPLPWSQIESRVRKGEQVEARGTARDLNVVLLATATLEQLNTLVQRTQFLDVFRTRASEEGKTPAGSQGAGGGALVGPGEATGGSMDGGEEKPFSVYGTVTDPFGRPMAGVEVTAHCGFATLMPTGRAVTDEAGRYTLRFKPGILSRDTILQAATICVRKVGFYEANLCRQGDLAMAGRMPSGQEQQRSGHHVGVVLPNQPHELNFVMRPAARIEGELVDARGKPLPGRTLVLAGDELYPSTNALTSVETDQDGAFVIESVPLESFWFEYGRRPPARSASIPFNIPGTWPIRLSYDESARGTPRLTIANLQQPTSVLGLLDPSVRTNSDLPVAELANGVTVTLLGLFTGPDMDRLQWWYPDGTPAPPERFAAFYEDYVLTSPNPFAYGYVLQFRSVPDMSVHTIVSVGAERLWAWTPGHSIGVGLVTSREGQYEGGLPGVGDIKVAVATGAYKTVGKSFDYGKVEGVLQLEEGYRLTLSTPHPQQPALINAVVNTDNLDLRLHSRLANNEVRIDRPSPEQKCQTGPLTSYDFYLTADKSYFINSISLGYRQADVVYFRNVALRPGQQTEVEMEIRPATPVPGPLGRHALSFDGVDDRLIVPARPSLALKSPFTVEIWFKPDPNAESYPPMALMQKGRKPDDPKKVQAGGFLLLGGRTRKGDVPGWGSLYVGRADGGISQVQIARDSAPERPGWAHICTRYTGTDFVPVADAPLLIGDDFVPDSLQLAGQALPFKGEIAEIRIWNRALTDAEVQWYRGAPLTGNEPNLVACWDFERRPGGQIVYDITPNQNHAYLGNSKDRDDADPRWVSLDAGQSLTTTSATEYVRRHLEDWKTTVRNNYLLKDYEILDEYVLEGSTGAVAFVWVRNTLIAAGGVDTKPHEGVIFIYRLNTDRWEGVFNFDGALGQAGNSERVDRLLATYRQEWCPQYLARIEQGYISAGGRRRPDRRDDGIPAQTAEGNASRQVSLRLADERRTAARQTEAAPGGRPSEQTQDVLKRLIDEAQPGGVVTVPEGRYATPVEISKPVVLRGESQEGCIIEVTADQPAVLINTGGKGEVTVENLTIQWQLATSGRVEQPFALAVKDTNAVIRNCRFVPLGDYRHSPVAVRIDGFAKTTVDNCRFNGFEYVICYGEGTEGTVQDCVIADCGHEGVINYARATLTVQRCLITGSKFHAVRCTGGTLHVKDNLLINNANRGIYLGNKTGRGTIANNLILGNGAGISGFGRAEYAVTNNVIVDNKYTAINMRDSCRLSIRDNVLAGNQGGIALYKEGTENYNVIAGNTYWSNTTDFENVEKPAGSLTADPQFADPNHGDFSVRGPAREAGHGLTNPQIIRELWKKYEQLQRERPAEPATRADSVPPPAQVQVSTPVPSQTQPPILPAWQRTDLYVPPDPDGFFPDDPEGGRRLDALFQAVDKDRRSDEEILSTVRQGLRRTTQHRTLILAWIGNRYIWGKEPQNPQAIEIMYHAVPLERHYAIYFGLSVVKNKSPNILRTLADICMQGEEVGRITWGVGPQRNEMLSYITPYLQDTDAGKREIAGLLVKHFRGELDFEKWQRERRLEQIKVEFQDQLPRLRETLLTGDSQARREALTTIQRNGLGSILDGSFLAALEAAATDRDWKVRNDVARLAGGRWVWNAPAQDPNAIDLMLRLSRDGNREVYYNAVYFGLSTVRDKGEPVVRRLIEMALADHENNLYGRIIWGLKGPMKAAPESFVKTLAQHLDRAKSDVHHAASVYLLYRDVLGQEPPGQWGLAHIKERYPEDLFAVPFSAREPFAPKDADALWAVFAETLPDGITARRLPEWGRRGSVICSAGVRGREQADTVKESIESNPRLRLGESYPLPLSVQLFLEEEYGPAAPGPVGGLPESQPQAKGPAPAEAVAAAAPAPGPIQQRIDAAAPGATIRLEPGVYKERLVINKPLTLEGAGWDKTVVMTEKENFGSLEEVQRIMMQRVAQGRSDAEREQIAAQVKKELVEKMSPQMLSVENAQGVVVRGIKFSSPGGRVKGASTSLPIVKFDHSRARMVDCAVLAGPGNGIHIEDGSDVEIDRTLVAAVWGTGLGVTSGAEPSRAHVRDSDIRNCHYAGIRIAGRSAEAVIERCRISGAAWHGVRYDNVSPTLRNNLIFGNARCGIYASGQTAATVKGNLLYDNEMTGMSCWFQNQDVIEGNTFAANERSGLEVLGASKPVVVKNIFYDNPTAVHLGNISGSSPFAQSDGQIALEDNLFWANEHNVQWRRNADAKQTIRLDEKAGAVADPQFADPNAKDFSLPADSPARQKGIGAAGLIPFESPWPLQPEELAIIPKGDTRDSRQWQGRN